MRGLLLWIGSFLAMDRLFTAIPISNWIFGSLLGIQSPLQSPVVDNRPNIIFILTDDQDLHMDSLNYTQYIQQHLLSRGTFYKRHFCTTALCCPARASILTGKLSHNTNVTDISPPYGGYPKFISQGLNSNYLPIWLSEANYSVYYAGKLFNYHNTDNYNKPFAAGWTGSDFLLDPYTYQYLNGTYQRNHDPPVNYPGQYTVDVLADKAYALLDDAFAAGKPFFLGIAPCAPHSNAVIESGPEYPGGLKATFNAPVPAERHQDLFPDAQVPRTPNFNPANPSGANWIRNLTRQNQTNVEGNDCHYRRRLQALQSVDEMVDGIFTRLERLGILDNTYIFYTSDNGYHLGHHRLEPGKETGFEEDINVPLIVRGPGVPENYTAEIITTHTDLAPTWLTLAGAPLRPDFDGEAIPLTVERIANATQTRQEHVTVEYWGIAISEGIYLYPTDLGIIRNNTYKAVRVIGSEYSLYYSVWCTNEHELYDMTSDPYQMINLLLEKSPSTREILGRPIEKVVQRLDALLMVLKSCQGYSCVNPWDVLFPRSNVHNLQYALSPRYDYFFDHFPKQVEYSYCAEGYILDAEGPQFDAKSLVYRDGVAWHHWT